MGLLDFFTGGLASLFGGGGGGAAASAVNYGVVSTIQGGSKPVGLVSTVQGGSSPLAVAVGGTGTPAHAIGEVRLPQPLRTSAEVDANVKTESEVAFTRPIVSDLTSRSDISSRLDVEPVQVDLCVDVGVTKLPRARITQPYDSHFGVTVLGAEVVGFDWRGQSEVHIDDHPPRPHIELGDAGHAHRDVEAQHRAVAPRSGGGLEIRV